VRSIAAAAFNIRRLSDKIEEVRKRTGGGSKTLGSDDAQELQSYAAAVDFETYKAFDLGAPSSGDKEMGDAARGGVDITSFLKDPKKGLQTYADTVEKKALSHLRVAGYTGPAIRFHRAADLKKSESNVVDDLGAKLVTAVAGAPRSGDPLNALSENLQTATLAPKEKELDEWLFQLTALAEVPNELGAQARAPLQASHDAAVYPEVKARIKKVLDSLDRPQRPR